MKQIAILGSTGSIGKNAVKIARHLRDRIRITVLAARDNIDLLEQQARECHPKLIAVYHPDKAQELQRRLPEYEVVGGMDGLEAAASHDSVDFVISAISGTMGLKPTLAAIQAKKNIGLANKEALVSGGALVMKLVKEKGVQLIPIDSEHSAIFQCLGGEDRSKIGRIILTSSGGPFRSFTKEQLQNVTVEQALNHPKWKMGPKITIDSSTLMNKGLEVIEAHWLFGVALEQIHVIVHPEHIIHSMVEFIDGSMIAQMCEPDMVVPIQYAMTYPERCPGLLKPFDFLKNSALQFHIPDTAKFRCLSLAYDAIRSGGTLPCYMNAANEVLVGRFLSHKLAWTQIADHLETLMARHRTAEVDSFETIMAVDALARQEASII